VIYAKTNQWYVQPFTDQPLAVIRRNLNWSIRTHLETLYAALFVHEGYLPPAALPELPGADGDVLATSVKDCR
jgi:hypothetical protein